MKRKVFYLVETSKGYLIRARKEFINSDNKVAKKYVYIRTVSTKKEAKKIISSLSEEEYYLSFKDLCQHYYNQMQQYKNSRQLKELRYCCNLVAPIHKILLDKLNDTILNNFISSVESKTIYRRTMTYLRKILTFGFELEILKENFAEKLVSKIKEFKTPVKKVFISESQINKLLKDDSDLTVRDILEILVNTDIPLHVILNLKKENVNLEEKIISIKYKNKEMNKIYYFPDKVKKILESRECYEVNYYFTNKKGNYLEYSVFRRYYYLPFLKRNNMREINISDFYNILNKIKD